MLHSGKWIWCGCNWGSFEEPQTFHSSFQDPTEECTWSSCLTKWHLFPSSLLLFLAVFTFLRLPTVCYGLFSTCHVTPAPRGSCWRRLERWWLLTRTHVGSTSRACPTSRPASRSLWGTVQQLQLQLQPSYYQIWLAVKKQGFQKHYASQQLHSSWSSCASHLLINSIFLNSLQFHVRPWLHFTRYHGD